MQNNDKRQYYTFKLDNSWLTLTDLGVQKLLLLCYGRPDNKWKSYGHLSKQNRQKFEEEVINLEGNLNIPDNTPCSDHHILPGNQINLMLRGAITSQDGKEIVEKYINSRKGIVNMILVTLRQPPPHKLKDEKEILQQISQQCNAILEVISAVFWFQYNLVYGPKHRSDDPKNNPEEKILSFQPSNTNKIYKDIITNLSTFNEKISLISPLAKAKTVFGLGRQQQLQLIKDNKALCLQYCFPALKRFFQLKDIHNVQWEKDIQGKDFHVKGIYQSNAPPKGTAGFHYDLQAQTKQN